MRTKETKETSWEAADQAAARQADKATDKDTIYSNPIEIYRGGQLQFTINHVHRLFYVNKCFTVPQIQSSLETNHERLNFHDQLSRISTDGFDSEYLTAADKAAVQHAINEYNHLNNSLINKKLQFMQTIHALQSLAHQMHEALNSERKKIEQALAHLKSQSVYSAIANEKAPFTSPYIKWTSAISNVNDELTRQYNKRNSGLGNHRHLTPTEVKLYKTIKSNPQLKEAAPSFAFSAKQLLENYKQHSHKTTKKKNRVEASFTVHNKADDSDQEIKYCWMIPDTHKHQPLQISTENLTSRFTPIYAYSESMQSKRRKWQQHGGTPESIIPTPLQSSLQQWESELDNLSQLAKEIDSITFTEINKAKEKVDKTLSTCRSIIEGERQAAQGRKDLEHLVPNSSRTPSPTRSTPTPISFRSNTPTAGSVTTIAVQTSPQAPATKPLSQPSADASSGNQDTETSHERTETKDQLLSTNHNMLKQLYSAVFDEARWQNKRNYLGRQSFLRCIQSEDTRKIAPKHILQLRELLNQKMNDFFKHNEKYFSRWGIQPENSLDQILILKKFTEQTAKSWLEDCYQILENAHTNNYKCNLFKSRRQDVSQFYQDWKNSIEELLSNDRRMNSNY